MIDEIDLTLMIDKMDLKIGKMDKTIDKIGFFKIDSEKLDNDCKKKS